jgi:hypothetical protein
MYEIDWIIQMILRGISVFVVCIVSVYSLQSYSKRKTLAMKYLAISFICNAIANGAAFIIASLNVFLNTESEILARILLVVINVNNLLASVYSVHFVSRAFYAKHNAFTLYLYDVSVSLLIGVTIMNGFSTESIVLKGNLDSNVLILEALLIMTISITVMKYSFVSAKKENDILKKRSIQVYGYGIVIFMISMILIIVLTVITMPMNLENSNPLQIFLNSITYLVTPINVYMMYIGCFQPEWFKKKYESWWISNQLYNKIKS